ncbi:MAG: MBL fold metallo-hydrolase [Deltaproteobacteria bacterium]|nr:MBL fold metallo-hydrolase [Deltaproteobacteria bacterium]
MIEEIAHDLLRIEIPLPGSPLKAVNSYVIRGQDRNLIVDTGLDHKECLKAMQAALTELQIDLRKTDFFITHLHGDHCGLVHRIATATSKTYLNQPDLEIIVGWAHGFPENELQAILDKRPGSKINPVWKPMDHFLTDERRIPVGVYHFQCIETPGHTKEHTCLFEPKKRILIAGDHILSDITPTIQCWSWHGNPVSDYLASLEKVAALEIELVLPGHGAPFSNLQQRIRELKQHFKRRAQEVLSVLADGPRVAYQLASQMTWYVVYASWDQFPPEQKWLATGETIAHLRYLEEEGLVVRTRKDNRVFFALHPG